MAADRLRRPHLGQEGASHLASSLGAIIRSVAVGRQTIRLGMDGICQAALSLAILPISREPEGRAGAWLGRLATGSASVGLLYRADVVLVLEPARPAEPPTLVERAKRWGLTLAELRLRVALVEGRSVIDHARREGVKESTMRTHARALLEKTHATNLKHLVSTFAR